MEKLNQQVKTYFMIMEQIAELEAQAEAIKDEVKAVMVDQTTEELKGDHWSATWHNTVTSRFDSKAFKAAHSDLYKVFCKASTSTRFTLVATKA